MTRSCESQFARNAGRAVIAALALGGAYAGDAASTPSYRSDVELSASEHRAAEDFEARVKQYRTLEKKLAATLPKLPKRATPAQVDENQRALGALIKTERAGAKRGELLTPDMQALVKRILAEVLGGADGKTIKASIMDENPGVPNLSVNDRYPDAVPSTMPPQVLKALPAEEELEYRFVEGRLS
jgi:hypothetical protein